MDVTVWIETGEYFLPSTIEFDERDGGLVGGSVTYRSEEGGEVTLSGGTRVTGWQPAEGGIWKAPLDRSVKLRSLYVNGIRARMASVKGYAVRGGEYKVIAGQAPWAWDTGSKPDRSIYTDIPMIRRNPEDVEITNFQLWNCNTVCVREVLQESNKVILVHQEPYGAIAQTCHWDNFDAGGRHQVANAYEFLKEPGQFYFDRAAKTLYYIPRPGEDLTTATVVAPRLVQLISIRGKDPAHLVRNLLFRGLHLAHSDWNLVEIEGSHGKASVQGACHFSAFTMLEVNCHLNLYRNFDVPPGAIQCEHCDHVGFLRNKIEHLAAEGIALPNDASHVRIIGNVIRDVAGSGVLVGHPQHAFVDDHPDARLSGGVGPEKEKYPPSMKRLCRDIALENNLIMDTTREFYGEAAVSAFYVEGLKVDHNIVDTTAFNGVSLGWGWEVMRNVNGKATSTAKNNSVSFNRFYRVMQRLNDSGAIYTLGAQPGTVVTGNYIEGVGSGEFPTIKRYGIHHDAGSAFITTRHNVLDIAPDIWTVHAFRWGAEHDVVVEDFYTTSLRSAQGAGSNKLSGYHFVPGSLWPPEAYAIILASGLEPSFLDILPPEEFPPQDLVFPASVMVTPGSRVPITPLPGSWERVLTRDVPAPSLSDELQPIPVQATFLTAPAKEGRYRVCARDAGGKLHPSHGVLVVRTAPPSVTGVEEGGTYDRPVAIHVEGSAVLDSDPTTLGRDLIVVKNGKHRLSVSLANGATRELSFEIRFRQEWIDADQGTVNGKVPVVADPAFPFKVLGPFPKDSEVDYHPAGAARTLRVLYSSTGNEQLQFLVNGQQAGVLKAEPTLVPGVGQIPTFRLAEFSLPIPAGAAVAFRTGPRKAEVYLRALIFSE